MTDVKQILLRRQKEKNPSLALFEMMEAFRIEMAQTINNAIKEIKAERVELAFNEYIHTLRGKPGEPADPKVVAGLMLQDEEFIEKWKPSDGHTPTEEELSALICEHLPKYIPAPIPGAPGRTPTKKELKALIEPLIKKMKPADGHTPTKEEMMVVAKPMLKTLFSEKGFDDTQIMAEFNKFKETITEWIKKIQTREKKKGGGKAGGGLGNVQHENTATSSATTTITTTYKIAAGGNAHWLYYNGQLLFKGTHYTVGGDYKTITFLITLEDNTNVSVLYVRS